MASPVTTESMKQALRIYQEKLCSYNEANHDLRVLEKRDVIEELEGDFTEWTAPVRNIYELTQRITAFLTIDDFDLLKSKFKEIKDYLKNIKGETYSEQIKWYSMTTRGDCKLRLDTRQITHPHVATTFEYGGETCNIEATLTTLQNELNKYTFTDTLVLSNTQQNARMSVLLARLQQM